jgi:hypothetical protein
MDRRLGIGAHLVAVDIARNDLTTGFAPDYRSTRFDEHGRHLGRKIEGCAQGPAHRRVAGVFDERREQHPLPFLLGEESTGVWHQAPSRRVREVVPQRYRRRGGLSGAEIDSQEGGQGD